MTEKGSLLDQPVTGSVAWSPFSTASRPIRADYMRFAVMESTPFWARQQTRCFIARCGGVDKETAATADLLVSELVTNAYEASESTETIGLSLRWFPRFLLIEVVDSSSEAPVLTEPDADALGGRGLQLVDEFSKAWGYFRLPGGLKAVYCTLSLPEEDQMSRYRCSCGFKIDNADELQDHLLMVFAPEDDQGNDGRKHVELVTSPAGSRRHVCACGFASEVTKEFDDHMLTVFVTPDHVGNDGEKHVVVTDPTEARVA